MGESLSSKPPLPSISPFPFQRDQTPKEMGERANGLMDIQSLTIYQHPMMISSSSHSPDGLVTYKLKNPDNGEVLLLLLFFVPKTRPL